MKLWKNGWKQKFKRNLRLYKYKKKFAKNYRGPLDPLINSLVPNRRAGYIMNAARTISRAFKSYKRRRIGQMLMNRYLPSDVSRYAAKFIN